MGAGVETWGLGLRPPVGEGGACPRLPRLPSFFFGAFLQPRNVEQCGPLQLEQVGVAPSLPFSVQAAVAWRWLQNAQTQAAEQYLAVWKKRWQRWH